MTDQVTDAHSTRVMTGGDFTNDSENTRIDVLYGIRPATEPLALRLSEELGVAHCGRCANYCHERSPMPGESWHRCNAAKLDDGSRAYCSRNVKNLCSEFKLTWNPLRRCAKHGEWWQPYL